VCVVKIHFCNLLGTLALFDNLVASTRLKDEGRERISCPRESMLRIITSLYCGLFTVFRPMQVLSCHTRYLVSLVPITVSTFVYTL